MILKMMSGEFMADSDSAKGYMLISEVDTCLCSRDNGKPILQVTFLDDRLSAEFRPDGNSFLMNEAGRTVSSFAYFTNSRKRQV